MNLQRITLSAFLAYFCVSGVLSTFGLISGPMALHFGVEVTEITSDFSWFTIGMLVGAGLAIDVVDRFPLRGVLATVFLVIALCLAGLFVATTLQQVRPLLGGAGVCLGIGLAAAATTIARSYEPEPRASMLVVTDACFSLAGRICASLTLYFLGQQLHWSSGYLVVAGAAALVVLLAVTSTYPDTGQHTAQDTAQDGAFAEQSRWSFLIWLCIGSLCLYTLGQYAMLWWLPQHLQLNFGASVDEAGAVVGQFWDGMFLAQLLVAWWVLRAGAERLVLIAAVSAAVCSIPLWVVTDLDWIPWLGALWGFGNLAFLKLAISFATQLQSVPSPRLVSALLFGATSGTAVSPWVTSQVVESFGTLVVLRFSTACYALIALIMLFVVWRSRSLVNPG